MQAEDSLKLLLDKRYSLYNNESFIETDPISIPKQYSIQQDVEISAFWTAMLAWGQRKTIINKGNELFALMDHAPFDFILNHKEKDREKFADFKHRTFQPIDTLYFLERLQQIYQTHNSLEEAFLLAENADSFSLKNALIAFRNYFFESENSVERTKKHVATPARNSACKRINMFLRWMVRVDESGVDFGLWKQIPTSALHIPLDVHVHRVAIKLGLTKRKQADWKTVEEITLQLRKFDPNDPSKYDYALFGMGVLEKDFQSHSI